LRQITVTLESWGCQQQTNGHGITACISYLLLVNRSPHLSDLPYSLLQETDQTATIYSMKRNIWKVSRALFAMGITLKHLEDSRQNHRIATGKRDARNDEE
ncbi:MAG TPA: hypothetical protein VGN34_26225, partial [Ktedonobacteraceae bacterium]